MVIRKRFRHFNLSSDLPPVFVFVLTPKQLSNQLSPIQSNQKYNCTLYRNLSIVGFVSLEPITFNQTWNLIWGWRLQTSSSKSLSSMRGFTVRKFCLVIQQKCLLSRCQNSILFSITISLNFNSGGTEMTRHIFCSWTGIKQDSFRI